MTSLLSASIRTPSLVPPLLLFSFVAYIRSRSTLLSLLLNSVGGQRTADHQLDATDGGGSARGDWKDRLVEWFTRCRMSSYERFLVAAVDWTTSWVLLKRLLPKLPLTPLLLPVLYPLPTFFPVLLPALMQTRPSFKASLLFAAALSILQEMVHLAVILASRTAVRKRKCERIGLRGIEIRGTKLVEDLVDPLQCSICLDSSTTKIRDHLESFCPSCRTPIHRSCLLQWWNSVQSTIQQQQQQQQQQPQQSQQRAMIQLSTFPELPPIAHATLVAIIEEYNMLGTSVIEFNSNSIRMNGYRLRTPMGSSSSTRTAEPWDMGMMEKVVVGEGAAADTGVTVFVDARYSKSRSAAGQEYCDDFDSTDTLVLHRQEMLGYGETCADGGDPEVARMISKSPGPTCPLCRSSLVLSIALVLPSSSTSSLATIIKDCTFNIKSCLENILLQMALIGVVHLSRGSSAVHS